MLLLAKKIWTALLVLIEALSCAYWVLACWVMGFFGLFMFGFFPEGWEALVLSLIFYGGVVFLIWVSPLNFPKWRDVLRRMEVDSGLKHRPLDHDCPALLNEDEAQHLWKRQQDILKQSLSDIQWSRPRRILASRDPYALRMLCLMLLICGFWVAGPLAPARIKDGLFPSINFHIGGNVQSTAPLTIWITPPEYTGLGQIRLTQPVNDLKIPAFSSIKVSKKTSILPPKFLVTKVDDESPIAQTDLEKGESGEYYSSITLPEDYNEDGLFHLALKEWIFPHFEQDFSLVADQPPLIESIKSPEPKRNGSLQFFLKGSDDYGIQKLTLYMTLDSEMEDMPIGEPYQETRIMMTPAGSETDIQPSYDLSSHSWAGLPVSFALEAMDAQGQVSYVGPIRTILPERVFRHPVARLLIGYRKKLIWERGYKHIEVAQGIEQILMRPDLFQWNPTVTLALRAAASRIYYTPDYQEDQDKAAQGLIKLLWDTALQIEDGNMSATAQMVRQAQQDLMQAMQDPNASNQEKEFLMQKYKEALARHMQSLQKELQKRMADTMKNQDPQIMPSPSALQNQLSGLMGEMMRKLEEALRSGDPMKAQEMLSQMEKMMEMFNPDNIQEMPEDMKMMQQGINELQEIVNQQQDLLDRTVKLDSDLTRDIQNYVDSLIQHKVSPTTPRPQTNTKAESMEQEDIRQSLDDLMMKASEVMGEIPPSMGNAEIEMRGSLQQLSQNNPGASIPSQEKALEYLKDSQDQMRQQLQQRMENMIMVSASGKPSDGMPQDYDPLGRPYDPNGDQERANLGSDVEVPDEMNRDRVREILELLRERAGQRGRPQEERDYYRRLLKTF